MQWLMIKALSLFGASIATHGSLRSDVADVTGITRLRLARVNPAKRMGHKRHPRRQIVYKIRFAYILHESPHISFFCVKLSVLRDIVGKDPIEPLCKGPAMTQ